MHEAGHSKPVHWIYSERWDESDDAEEVSCRQIIMRSLKHLVKVFSRTLKGSRERFDHIKKNKPT